MLLSHRRTELPARGAYLETHAAIHTRYRVHVVRNDRVISEDRLHLQAFDRRGQLGRPVVTVVLRGNARIAAFDSERWLAAGAVSAVGSKGAIVMRQSRDGEPYEALVVEWDPGSLADARPASFTTRALAPSSFEVVRRSADVVADRTVDAFLAAEAIAAALAVLREEGLPFGAVDARALIEEVPAQTLELSAALDDLLSDLRQRPMAVDLHEVLGLSLRQVNRIVADFHRRYGFNALGWRDARSRRRLMMGATLMTAEGATVEEVARAVGYASPTAFARAMARAGLPPPADVARTVAELRDRA